MSEPYYVNRISAEEAYKELLFLLRKFSKKPKSKKRKSKKRSNRK